MRRMMALALVVVLVVVMVVPAAEAGGAATNIVLGLASFAVFNSLFVAPFFYPRYAYAAPAPPYSIRRTRRWSWSVLTIRPSTFRRRRPRRDTRTSRNIPTAATSR